MQLISPTEEAKKPLAIVPRIIALWAVCEGALGGVIHGLHLPVSGLIVGSASICCISLLANSTNERGAILKATVLVAAFKMMLSPHSPPTAYLALFFQGLAGELLFWNRRYFRVACYFLAVICLVESSLQRVLVMTLIYGNDLWTAIDEMALRLTGKDLSISASLIIAYVALHALVGLQVGWLAATLPTKLQNWKKQYSAAVVRLHETEVRPQKKRPRYRLLLTPILVLALLLSWIPSIAAMLPVSKLSWLLLRSLLLLAVWYLWLGSRVQKSIQHWIMQRASGDATMPAVAGLLPKTQTALRHSWSQSSAFPLHRRLPRFFKAWIVQTLYHD